MNKSISNIIEKYQNSISSDEFHRYKSWDHCFQAFSDSEKSEILNLKLAFYLASWGMYRGSSGLLQKNHLIHKGAVEILLRETNQKLKCSDMVEVKSENVKAILALKDELAKHYRRIYFSKGTEKPRPISPTDTLLSKIILGTLGCVPAYDRYFIEGLKEMNMVHSSFNEASLIELFRFIDNNKKEFAQAQTLIKIRSKKHYPYMKLVDIYFWQIGYEKEIKE